MRRVGLRSIGRAVAACVSALLCVALPASAGAQITIPPGHDFLATDPESTSVDFAGLTAIPPSFFDPGQTPLPATCRWPACR